jgi:urease accessory protein
LATATACDTSPGWEAELDLTFRRQGQRTVLANRSHRGPLLVQRPFYPEGGGVCHGYILHPPGGLAGGDALRLRARTESRAWSLLTTPAAGKVYRSTGPEASLEQTLEVAPEARMEWLPQENILFTGSRARLRTAITLGEDARFFGWEVTCLGRPACGEHWHGDRLRHELALYREDRPLLLERTRLAEDDPQLSAAVALGGQPVFATLVATPANTGDLALAREYLAESEQFGVTLLDDVLVARYLGGEADRARAGFEALWQALRPAVMGAPASPPRIWRT